jgi:hypothetical protein
MKRTRTIGLCFVVAFAISAAGASTASANLGSRCVTVGQRLFTTKITNMRSGPNPKASVIIKITPKGSVLIADQSCPTKFVPPRGAAQYWYYVSFGRYTDWVVSGALRE